MASFTAAFSCAGDPLLLARTPVFSLPAAGGAEPWSYGTTNASQQQMRT